MLDLFLVGLITILVYRATRHGLAAGFPFAVACLILFPGQLRIESPGSLPEITVHRLILLVLLLRWRQAAPLDPPPDRSLHGVLTLALISRGISDVMSITPAASLKDLLAFSFESIVYYHLAAFALASPAARRGTVLAIAVALSIVAGVAFVERYVGVSLPLLLISHFKYCYDGIQSTYPHRILLGYAMAMGTPLTLLLLDRAETPRRRRLWWGVLAALIVACFLADSRGGWIGMALAGALSFITGSSRTRKRCLGLLLLAIVTLLCRPGIRETIVNRIQDTVSDDSYKGVSYQYRWRLWTVAIDEITKSPERLVFGYGGLSTESMNLSQYFRAQEGGAVNKTGFTSWDNQYASDLIEFGVFGIGAEILLLATLTLRMLRQWLHASVEARPLIAATLVGSLVYMFARTNVYIFGEQLKFLFWTIVAAGLTATRTADSAAEPNPAETPDPLLRTSPAL